MKKVIIVLAVVSIILGLALIFFSRTPYPNNEKISVSGEKINVDKVCSQPNNPMVQLCPNGDYLIDGLIYNSKGYYLMERSRRGTFYSERGQALIDSGKAVGCFSADAEVICEGYVTID